MKRNVAIRNPGHAPIPLRVCHSPQAPPLRIIVRLFFRILYACVRRLTNSLQFPVSFQYLPQRQGARNDWCNQPYSVTFNPSSQKFLSLRWIYSSFRFSKGIDLRVDRLHVDSRVDDGNQVAQRRDGIDSPVTKISTGTLSRSCP